MGKILILFILATTLFAEKKEDINAKSYLLIDLQTTEILKQKKIDLILPIASITKLATALIAIEEKNQKDTIKIYKSTVLRNEGDKSAILKEGEYYSLKDLLLTMLVSSTNVSAISIANAISGSPDYFIQRMNDWAKAKSLLSTSFGDTFGLSHLSKSSAKDISILLDLVNKNASLLEILETTNYSIQEINGRLQNLSSTNEMPYYKDFRIIGKTGTTKLAGKCFAGFAVRNKKKWKIIVLGSENVFRDMKTLLDTIN